MASKEATAKFRAHSWINTNTLKPIFSIQARVGKNGWAHIHEGGKPAFFTTEQERDAVLEKWNAES